MKRLRLPALILLLVNRLVAADNLPQPGSPSSSEANPSTAFDLSRQTKPDIAQLLEAPVFTNGVGMELLKLSPSLWAGKFEVTQTEYQKVMGANPSQFVGEKRPVDSVSWNEALSFCRRLTESERTAGMLTDAFVYALPTQAEWESLVAGAGLPDAVTSYGKRSGATAAVGSSKPNGLGLYDVRGNVAEWCLDPQDQTYRILRGGAWDASIEVNLRPEFRVYARPDERKSSYGFRVVLKRTR